MPYPAWIWDERAAPKIKQLLVVAVAKHSPSIVKPVRVIAEWVASVDEWRPVKVAGDKDIGVDLNIICWTEIPDIPATH